MKIPRPVLAVLLVLEVLSAATAEAQLPRPQGSLYNTYLINRFLQSGRFTNTVTLDAGGAGDFTDLSEALAFVTSRNPTLASPWSVLVYPGTYTETSLTLPPFTLLQGIAAPGARSLQLQGRPVLQITGTTGAGVTFSPSSSLVDVGLIFSGVLTAGYKGVNITTGAASTALTRVMIFLSGSAPNVPIDILSITGGSLNLEDTAIQRGGNGMTATRHVFCSGGSAVLSGAWLLASSSQAAVVETAGGVIRILNSRIFGGAAVDLKNTSGTLSADQVSYTTETGTITRAGILSPRITAGAATVPPACTPPEIYLDTTTTAPRLCACITANTWRCAPLV